MTEREVRETLERARKAKERYNLLRRSVEEIETIIQGLSVDYSIPRVQSSANNDKLASMMDRLSTMRTRCINQADECIKGMEEAKRLIDLVDDELAWKVMTRRYILGQKWEELSREIPVAYGHAFYLRNEAIKKIALIN